MKKVSVSGIVFSEIDLVPLMRPQLLFTLLTISGVFLASGCNSFLNPYRGSESPIPSPSSLPLTPTIPNTTPENTIIVSSPNSFAAGFQGNGPSYKPALSADGRYVVFESLADNLIPNDTNGAADIFLRDRHTNQIVRVNVSANGSQANDDSHSPAISADGRYVAFSSWAGNLVAGDTYRCGLDHESCLDIFIYDRETGLVDLISRSTDGEQANGPSESPVVSANGRYVVFVSHASNLVSSDTNRVADIFLRDRQTNQTKLISKTSNDITANGSSASPSISSNGRFIVFWSSATNLTPEGRQGVFIHDSLFGTTQWIGEGIDPGISGNGNHVVFLSIGLEIPSLVIWDRESGIKKNGPDILIEFHGRELGITHISADGRWVAFSSKMQEVFQVFLYDFENDTNQLVSTTPEGVPGNDTSWDAEISTDGNIVVFSSNASNLVANDTNQVSDVLLYDRLIKRLERVSVPSAERP